MDTETPNVYKLADEAWAHFYSLGAIARALSHFADGSQMGPIRRETVGGLIVAAELIADRGEKLTAAAREAAPLPLEAAEDLE